MVECIAAESPYLSVYQALDDVFCGSPPPGAKGALFRAIDGLMRSEAPPHHVALAQRISLAVHKLELALRSADAALERTARQELQEAGAEWLQVPMRVAQ